MDGVGEGGDIAGWLQWVWGGEGVKGVILFGLVVYRTTKSAKCIFGSCLKLMVGDIASGLIDASALQNRADPRPSPPHPLPASITTVASDNQNREKPI